MTVSEDAYECNRQANRLAQNLELLKGRRVTKTPRPL